MVAYGALPLIVFPISSLTKWETRIAMGTSVGVISTSNINIKRNICALNKGFKDVRCIVHAISTDSFVVDDQISSTSSSDENQLEELVKKIKKIIVGSKTKEYGDVEELVIIDAIQRLGLEYYFRDEIGAALEKHNVVYYYGSIEQGSDSLHDVALRFRLLRQHGYTVSSDALAKFKDKDGNFNQELAKDIKGLMSLFEASQFSTRGDYILDEANKFSSKLLKTSLKNVEQYEGMIIGNTLRYPYHKSLPRLMAKKFLPYFKTSLMLLHDSNHINNWINDVHDLARIDITLAQISHQLELAQVSRWWEELQLAKELKVARHKPMIWHMWCSALLPDPNMAQQRIDLTKPISLIYIFDDIFDACATLEELTIFTQAVNKWEDTNIDELPRYLKMCLKVLFDSTNETSQEIYLKHGWNPEVCLRKAWADLCNAFLVEAKWFASGYLPTTKELLENGILSSGVDVAFIYVFALLGGKLTLNATDLFNVRPEIVSSTAITFRLWNGLGGAKDENEDAHDNSFIACYLNENKGSSAESAREYALEMISDTWKVLNMECLSNSQFSVDFKTACLNMARMIPVMYDYDVTH